MNYFLIAIIGIIQGLTEFFPVSSSGHLLIFREFFQLDFGDNIFFDVVLHLGTLAALGLFFQKKLKLIARGLFSGLTKGGFQDDFSIRLAFGIVLAVIPAAFIGFFLEDFISDYLRSSYLTATMLIIGAVIFWLVEKLAVPRRNLTELGFMDAIIIGFAQLLAFIPGTSRSGITIVAGLARKFRRVEAAEFSLLLSMPVIFGAGLKKFFGISDWLAVDWLAMAIGFGAAFISGYLAIKYLLKYLENHSLGLFAWYRLVIGCLIFGWLIFFGG